MAFPAPVIDAREFQQLSEQARVLRLTEMNPQVSILLRSINVLRPSNLDVRVYGEFKTLVTTMKAALDDNPFLPAPPTISQGEFVLAYQKSDGMPICVSREELTRHLLVIGASGSGKTMFTHHLLLQLLHQGINTWILDLKDDCTYIARAHKGFVTFDKDIAYNPLEVQPHMTRPELIERFTKCFAKAFYGADYTEQLITAALNNAYAATPSPSLEDLLAAIRRTHAPRKETNISCQQKLQRIQNQYPTLFKTRHGLPFSALTGCLLFPVEVQTEANELLFQYLVDQLQAHNAYYKIRNRLTHEIVMDEGLFSWNKDNNKIEGAPLLARNLQTARETGLGFDVTVNSLQQTSRGLRTNAYSQVAMNLTDSNDATEVAHTFGMNQAQREYLDKRLTRGECIIRLGDRWREPILAVFPNLPINKNATAEPARDTAPNANVQPEPRRLLVAASKPPDDTTAPRPVKFTISEEALLRCVCKKGTATVTEAYEGAGLPPQVGDRAKKKLEALGYVTCEPIVARPGRGGAAIAITPTPLAYERLNSKPPKTTRGGDSAQHRFVVTNAANNTGGTIETTLGTKSVDLLFRLTPAHDNLMAWLSSNAHHLSLERAVIAHNDLVAIEVEVSDPAKTAPRNVTGDLDAGVALVVIATLPKLVAVAKRCLLSDVPTNLLSRVVVVDALQFLDALRTGG